MQLSSQRCALPLFAALVFQTCARTSYLPSFEDIASNTERSCPATSIRTLINEPFRLSTRTWPRPTNITLIVIEPSPSPSSSPSTNLPAVASTTPSPTAHSTTPPAPPSPLSPTPSNATNEFPDGLEPIGPIASLWVPVSLSVLAFVGWLAWEVYRDIEEMLWLRRERRGALLLGPGNGLGKDNGGLV